ncbi:MAG: tetratricopeptide repeat protein [Polyangiaceae bacterium]|nr:tetratricopeptide repeat protein [Polyangiaceae bacterium]
MLVLLVVLTVVVVAYAGVMDAPLLWDDVPLLDHPSIAQLRPLWEYLSVPFWDMSSRGNVEPLFYRPLTTLSLALDAHWHGRNPTGFHLTNLALHVVNVSLVFFLARRLQASVLAAGAGALIWGVLPRLAECVSWIAGRTDELGALGVLAALLIWRRGSMTRVCIASAAAAIGMLGKEMAIAAAFALAVGELWPRPSRGAWMRALVPLATLVSFVTLRTAVVGHLAGPALEGVTPSGRVLTVFESVGRYVWMTLDVWHPATQIGVVGGSCMRFVVFGVVALLAAGVLVGRYARRMDGTWALLIVAGVVPVLLVIHAVPLPWMVVACDRLMYLPWAILAVAAAAGASRWKLVGWRRLAGAAGVSGFILSLVLATRARTAVFADEVEFWTDALETTPSNNWLPTFCVNELYARGGLYRESLSVLLALEGRAPQPIPTDTRPLVARALGRLGRYEEAYRIRREIEVAKRTPGERLDEALAALHVFDLARASELAEQARRELPQYERAKRIESSIAEVRRLRKLLSESPPSGLEGEIVRARLDTLAGRGPDAEQAWSTLLARPDLPAGVADEGFAVVADIGSRDALRRALKAYSVRPDARRELIVAAKDRLAFADRLQREWPRVVRALVRLRRETH